MKKTSLYSRSVRRPVAETPRPSEELRGDGPVQGAESVAPPPRFARSRRFVSRHERILVFASAVLLSVGIVYAYLQLQPAARQITQHDIDAAVLHTLDSNVLPSAAAKAYDIVSPSVVRVRRLEHLKDEADD